MLFSFKGLKFIYPEKATNFCEISILLLTTVHTVKSKMKIWQNFVAFSEYMNFITFFSGRRIRPGVVVFTAMAIYGVSQKANADLGGELWGQTPPTYFEKDR